MKTPIFVVIFFLSSNFAHANGINLDLKSDNSQPPSSPTNEVYQIGIDLGIINPEKYPLEAFEHDDQNVFKDLYKEYLSLYDDQIDYEEWLIMNNFGILPDTQESLLEKKSNVTRSNNKQKFLNTVRTGDILITGNGIGGLVGHAAIMTTDNWVVEMPGGKGWQNGITSNNRRISKSAWYEVFKAGWTNVYRCRNNAAAKEAASWATRRYFNSKGGNTKNVHITYKITTNTAVVNTSYCSKLVVQAYHYGTGSRKVIDTSKLNKIIVPTTVPSYFLSGYTLRNIGKF
ncbi:uncharacterized protein LOC114366347 [Ostrinia furnacalis]|uniref:uncharacterized protein LOC114366347 n=1 Tax=Ostrinia furnacalis TaxID=93504 RepID=UPI00103DDF38|nr:uncharacterized protein LOC114366347 [Ostrinia furnacalis]